jgi:hypothetical protein
VSVSGPEVIPTRVWRSSTPGIGPLSGAFAAPGHATSPAA